jgi:hypothetical protein
MHDATGSHAEYSENSSWQAGRSRRIGLILKSHSCRAFILLRIQIGRVSVFMNIPVVWKHNGHRAANACDNSSHCLGWNLSLLLSRFKMYWVRIPTCGEARYFWNSVRSEEIESDDWRCPNSAICSSILGLQWDLKSESSGKDCHSPY